MPLDDVVILDIDKNEFNTPFDDMDIFPHEVVRDFLFHLKLMLTKTIIYHQSS